MYILGFIAFVLTLAVGYGCKIYLDKQNSQYEITWKEFLVASAVMLCVVIPATLYFGRQAAISNQVTFYENWSGYETYAEWIKIKCERDGVCRHCYDCDPYQVEYECGGYEGTGENRRYVSKTCERTEYHKCPYTDYEWTFVVWTTVGDFTIAANNFPTNPSEHKFRWLGPRPPSHIESGVPEFWSRVDQRVKANTPGPVVSRNAYDNYILASQRSIMKRYNDAIDGYKKDNQLPQLATSPQSFYYLDRTYQVGVNLPGNWAQAIQRFNAAFGMQLQGDLHLVFVDGNKVLDPDNYMGALMAYWQSPVFGKNALAKNAVVIAIGTKDGRTASWARASTGMPLGNEHLIVQLQNDLKGVELTPENLLGSPTASLTGNRSVSITHTNSVLEQILWGPNQFKRVHMKSGNKDGEVGFSYLLTEIEPTTGQMVMILLGVLFFAGIAWAFCIRNGVRSGRYNRRF